MMTWYIVRVQLVQEKANYTKLHEEMEKRGFTRDTEFGSENDLRRLPFATYFFDGQETGEQIRQLAWAASQQVDINRNKILVARTDHLWMKNLLRP